MARTSSDPLKALATLRNTLELERTRIMVRLGEINAAIDPSLASLQQGPATEQSAPAAPSVPTTAPKKRKTRAKNELSLKEAVLQVTAKTALTKVEILEAVEKLGYKFSGKNPANSLGTLLYGKKPKFKNQDGKFSPA